MRATLALLVAAVLVPLVIGAGVLLTEPEKAAPSGDLTYTQGSYSIRLTGEPCPFPEFILELEEEGVPPARASVQTIGGRTISGCYALDMTGSEVYTRDHAGNSGELPVAWFGRAPP